MENRLKSLKQLMQKGHCADSIAMVHNTHNNSHKLMETYLYYIKPCTQKDFPDLEFMRVNFGAEFAKYGGYIDVQGKVPTHKQNVFVGNCNAQIVTENHDIVRCLVRHNSKLEVLVKDNSRLHIDCFEDAEVNIHIDGNEARVFVSQYGNSKISVSGNIANALMTLFDCKTYK